MFRDDDDDQGDGWQPEPSEQFDFSASIPELDLWRDAELETYQQDATAALVVCLQHDPHARGIRDEQVLRRRVQQITRHNDGELLDDTMGQLAEGTLDTEQLKNELRQIPLSHSNGESKR